MATSLRVRRLLAQAKKHDKHKNKFLACRKQALASGQRPGKACLRQRKLAEKFALKAAERAEIVREKLAKRGRLTAKEEAEIKQAILATVAPGAVPSTSSAPAGSAQVPAYMIERPTSAVNEAVLAAAGAPEFKPSTSADLEAAQSDSSAHLIAAGVGGVILLGVGYWVLSR